MSAFREITRPRAVYILGLRLRVVEHPAFHRRTALAQIVLQRWISQLSMSETESSAFHLLFGKRPGELFRGEDARLKIDFEMKLLNFLRGRRSNRRDLDRAKRPNVATSLP